jgi:hypothetical protein
MKHSDFALGRVFWSSDRQWRCTDVGSRVIVAIRIDAVEIGSNEPSLRQTLNREQAEAKGWFNGPPHAVAEVVFDEDDIEGCSLEPMAEA